MEVSNQIPRKDSEASKRKYVKYQPKVNPTHGYHSSMFNQDLSADKPAQNMARRRKSFFFSKKGIIAGVLLAVGIGAAAKYHSEIENYIAHNASGTTDLIRDYPQKVNEVFIAYEVGPKTTLAKQDTHITAKIHSSK